MGVGCSVVGMRRTYCIQTHRADENNSVQGSNVTYDSYQLGPLVPHACRHHDFLSYTSLDPSCTELAGLMDANIDINCFPHLVNFDVSFYGTLRMFDMKATSFAHKDYASQKRFVHELLTHILCHESDQEVFEVRSKSFVKRFIFEGVPLAECECCTTIRICIV